MIQTIQYQDCIALERFPASHVEQYDVELPSFVESRELSMTICLTPDHQVQSLLFPLDTPDQDLTEFAQLRWLSIPTSHTRRRVSPVYDVIEQCGEVDVVLCYPGPRHSPWRDQDLGDVGWIRPTTWAQFEQFRAANNFARLDLMTYGITDWFHRHPSATDESFIEVLRQTEEYASIANFYDVVVAFHRAEPKLVTPLLSQHQLTSQDDWSPIASQLPRIENNWMESLPLVGPRLTPDKATQLTITTHAIWPQLAYPLVSLLAYTTSHGRLIQLDAFWWTDDIAENKELLPPIPPDYVEDVIFVDPEETLYPLVVQNHRLVSPIENSYPDLL